MRSRSVKPRRLAITEHLDSSSEWNISNVLTEKNRNTTLGFISTCSKPFKKNNLTSKALTSNIQRMPLTNITNDCNMANTTSIFCNSFIKKRPKQQKSNIEQLKK